MREQAYSSDSANQMENSDFSAPNLGSIEAGGTVQGSEGFWITPIELGRIISTEPYAAETFSVLGNSGHSLLGLAQWGGMGVTTNVATPIDAPQHAACPDGNQSLLWYPTPRIPTYNLPITAASPESSSCNDFQVDAQWGFEAQQMENPSISCLHPGSPLQPVYLQTPTPPANPGPEDFSFSVPPIQATAPPSAYLQALSPIASINPTSFNCNFCMQSFTRDADRIRHENATHLGNLGQQYLCPIPGCVKSQGNGYSRADKVTEHLWKKHASLGYVKRI